VIHAPNHNAQAVAEYTIGLMLAELENRTLTNHRAGDTRGSYWNVPDLLRKDLLKYLHGESPQFFANPQVAE
jgi:phosphoglycerate dehydrogenase-like enzyme